MAKKTEAYVDTSALIAFLDQSDSHHLIFRQLFSNPPALITSPLVIAEGHAWFLRRFDENRAIQFLNFIEDFKVLKIKTIGAKEMKEAAKIIQDFSDQSLTLADAVGLYFLKFFRLKNCWSTDRHLGLSGVPLVIHQR